MTRLRVLAVVVTVVVGVAGLAVGLTVESGAAPRAPGPGAGSAAAAGRPASPPRAAVAVRGDVKSVAAQFVKRVGTWPASPPMPPAARISAAGYPPELTETVRPLLDPPADESTTTVVYPQLGGLTEASASVIVLARQERRVGESRSAREVTLDVRLRQAGDGWAVTSVIEPPRAVPARPRPGGPTELGRRLLATRVALPGPVRDDIITRRLDDSVIATTLELAGRYDLELQVAVSGHPGIVFPRPRLSNHAVGRAVDVRAVNGRRVADIPRTDPLLADFMSAAGRAGATEVGGPIRVTGRGVFTDAVHQDHFHVGITPGKPPATVAGR